MPEETELLSPLTDDADFVAPEDYKAYNEWRDGGGGAAQEQEETPAAGAEETPISESSAKAEGQSAEGSDPAGEAEQEEAEAETQQEEPGEENKRLARRMRKLTGKIAALESRLAELGEPVETGEEESAEIASAPETAATDGEPLKRPMLKDFEDTADKSAWDQYEEAMEAYNDARVERAVATAVAKQQREDADKHARETAQAAWNQAASRYPNYNEVVARDEVKISAAMESVMRMDPVVGTSLAYYLGEHPEESLKIAQATLAQSEADWPNALARAGVLLGEVKAKLPAPPGAATAAPTAAPPAAAPAPKGQPKPPAKGAAPAPKTATPTISRASRPPSQIRGAAPPPARTDVYSEDDARDYAKWNTQREKEIAAQKRK